MVNEGHFFSDEGSNVSGVYGADFSSKTPKNASSRKKRPQTPKNCCQPGEQSKTTLPDNFANGSAFRQPSPNRVHGRRQKNKPRNTAMRSSPQNLKKSRQRAPSEEPDIIARRFGQLTEILQRIPYRAIGAFITQRALWALSVIAGLSWLFITFVVQSSLTLYAIVSKWYEQLKSWLVKKFPFLRRPPKDFRTFLPKTGEEAVQRLLKLKESDPYTILGLNPAASDDDIRKSYRSQAVLVHPDKNHSPKAEDAFKILASAFEILGNEEKKADFDSTFKETEPKDLMETLLKKIQESQNIMGCRFCSGTHNRYPTGRPPFEARYCSACRTMHAAREGDLWAETSMLGFRWHFYAYLDNAVYDVTEWMRCQKDLLVCMEPNTHRAPCRLNIPRGYNSTLTRLLEELFGQGL